MKSMMKNEVFGKSYVKVKVDAVDAEKLLNYLMANNVMIKNIVRNNAFSISMDVEVSNYHYLVKGVKKLNGRIEIQSRKGPIYLGLKLRERKFMLVGIVIFAVILYYLSSFIWQIDIKTDRYLAPLEVRNILKGYGVECGTKKSKIDVKELERKLTDDVDEVMWIKVRIEGSRLTVEIVERQEPPEIVTKDMTGNVVASKPGVINTIYASSGTPIVKPGDIVSKGDILIKGQEGIEGKEYPVMAAGKAFATTFYEETETVSKTQTSVERTGRSASRYGVCIGGKTYYLKKPLNKFENYDKIERKWGIFIKETQYETEEKTCELDSDKIANELQNKIVLNLDRACKVLDIKSEAEEDGENYNIRVLVTVEEDIAEEEEVPYEEKIQEDVVPDK